VILVLSTYVEFERDKDKPFKREESIPLTTDVKRGIKRQILSISMPVKPSDASNGVKE